VLAAPAAGVYRLLESIPRGLSGTQVAERRGRYGANVLPTPPWTSVVLQRPLIIVTQAASEREIHNAFQRLGRRGNNGPLRSGRSPLIFACRPF
jgi:Cation transporter/ATPase, N-terminus